MSKAEQPQPQQPARPSNEQVVQITAQVFANTTGTLNDHMALQAALKVIEEALLPVAQAEKK